MALAPHSFSNDQSSSISDLTLTPAAPSGASVDGRLLVAVCVYTEGEPGWGNPVGGPAGWTALSFPFSFDRVDGYTSWMWIGYKITSSEPGSYTFTTPMSPPFHTLILASGVSIGCYTGIDAGSPFDVSGYNEYEWPGAGGGVDIIVAPSVAAVNGTVPATTYDFATPSQCACAHTIAFNDDDGGTSPLNVIWKMAADPTPITSPPDTSPNVTIDNDFVVSNTPDFEFLFTRPAELLPPMLKVSFDGQFII